MVSTGEKDVGLVVRGDDTWWCCWNLGAEKVMGLKECECEQPMEK